MDQIEIKIMKNIYDIKVHEVRQKSYRDLGVLDNKTLFRKTSNLLKKGYISGDIGDIDIVMLSYPEITEKGMLFIEENCF